VCPVARACIDIMKTRCRAEEIQKFINFFPKNMNKITIKFPKKCLTAWREGIYLKHILEKLLL